MFSIIGLLVVIWFIGSIVLGVASPFILLFLAWLSERK